MEEDNDGSHSLCYRCLAFTDKGNVPALYVLLRTPDVCDGSHERHQGKYAQLKRAGISTASCKAGCFQLQDDELAGRAPISIKRLVMLLCLAFDDKDHALVKAVNVTSQQAIHNVFVHEHVHGSSMTFRLELALSSFVTCTTLNSFWGSDGVRKHLALPFTRFGKALTVDLLSKLYSKAADFGSQGLLETVETRSVQAKHAVWEYAQTKDVRAYAVQSEALPFACPPAAFVDAVANVVQPRLAVNLKQHQFHVAAWVIWREKHGYVRDAMGLTWDDKKGLDLVVSAAQNCKVKKIVQRDREPYNFRGGMLLDEMGLGKTIEMLAAIAHDEPVRAYASKPRPPLQAATVAQVVPLFDTPFCEMDKEDFDSTPSLVLHGVEDLKSNRAIMRGGTLIVAPSSLCSQWVDEIRNKLVRPEEYPVVKHYGSARHADLTKLQRSQTAVVLTTYEIVSADAHHASKTHGDFIRTQEWSCNRNVILSPLKSPEPFMANAASLYQVIQYVGSNLYTRARETKTVVITAVKAGVIHARNVAVIDERFNSIAVHGDAFMLSYRDCSTATVLGTLVVCTMRNTGAYRCVQCGFDPTATLEAWAEQHISPALARFRWKRIICDESHRLKPNLECLRHLQALTTKRRWCLTGTPYPHADEDKILGQLLFLQVPQTTEKFRAEDYKMYLADMMVRHTKATASDVTVGSISHVVIRVDMNATERKYYDAVAKQTESLVQALKVDGMLTSATRNVMGLLYRQRLACTLCSSSSVLSGSAGGSNTGSVGVPADALSVDCPVCWEAACPGFAPFECTHGVCYFCVQTLLEAGINKCPMCRNAISETQVRHALQKAKAGVAGTQRAATRSEHEESKTEETAEEDRAAILGDSKTSALLQYLSIRDVPTVVFTQFNECVDVLHKVLLDKGYNVFVVRGSMTESSRGNTISKFKACKTRAILLLTLRSASFGLNLAHASRLVHMDVALQEVQERQANGRVHRQGQCNDVEVCHLVCADSVEENITAFRNAAALELDDQRLITEGGVRLLVESDKGKRQRELQILGLVGSTSRTRKRQRYES